MAGIAELIDGARAAGMTLVAERGQLVIRGPREAEFLAKRLLARKSEVLAALSAEPVEPWDWSVARPLLDGIDALTDRLPVPDRSTVVSDTAEGRELMAAGEASDLPRLRVAAAKLTELVRRRLAELANAGGGIRGGWVREQGGFRWSH